PSPPRYQTITPDKTFASIIWSTNQTDVDCIPQYLNVSCEALEEDNTDGWAWVVKTSYVVNNISNESTTTVIQNLSEFTNYTCSGTLVMGNESVPTDFFTFMTDAEVSTAPLNLTVANKRNVTTITTVTWEKPIKNPGVFINYQIYALSYGPNHFVPEDCEINITETWDATIKEEYTLYHLFPDYIYEISVFVTNSAGNGTSSNINITMPIAASIEPRGFKLGEPILDEDLNVITRDISWIMPCSPNGPISQFEIYLEGYYVMDNRINDTRILFEDTKTDTAIFSKQIENMMPATNYTISIRANGENKTGNFYTEMFVTEDNLPGVPFVDTITDKGPTFFVVSWEEPERRAGIITTYNIEVVSSPLYYINMTRCPFQKVFNYVLNGDIRMMYFFPVPEKPAKLEFILTEYNVSGLISWIAPCSINGPPDVFKVTISETYTDDSSLRTEYTQTVPFNNNIDTYSHRIELKEAYLYDVNIRIVLKDGTDGEADSISLTTPDGYPGAPIISNPLEIEDTSFTVTWNPPITKNGRILYYQINITSLGPLYETHCPKDSRSFSYSQDGKTNMFQFTEVPETVRDITTYVSNQTEEEYNAYANISFKEPCFINGRLEYYELTIFGSRQNFNNTEEIYRSNTSSFIFNLRPEYNYNFSITTLNEHFINTSNLYNFSAPAGVPKFSSAPINLNIGTGSSSAEITLKEEYFSNSNGDIRYIALILSEANVTGEYYNSWDGNTWPRPKVDGVVYYQLSEDYWYPFKGKEKRKRMSVCIHSLRIPPLFYPRKSSLKSSNTANTAIPIYKFIQYCKTLENNPEKLTEQYTLLTEKTKEAVRMQTTVYAELTENRRKNRYTNILPCQMTDREKITQRKYWRIRSKLYYERKRDARKLENRLREDSLPPTPIPEELQAEPVHHQGGDGRKSHGVLRRRKHVKALNEEINKLRAKLEKEKRKKDKYRMWLKRIKKEKITKLIEGQNISPAVMKKTTDDETRVKLLIDEDDEIGSDYINASYIRGYSGKVEYIATQGPLPTTCRDFWKMVIQENVSIIVMVTQFIEQNKDTVQATVTHMQYLDWPDFNVPNGTENMLQFCYQLRERLQIEGGYVIIHCSAGVGRTGTLIATDILLQNAIAAKNIDVFNTVLELRKQRTHMVQTQKQYMYIHNLVKDSFDQSHTSGINENSEPLYENLSALQMKTDDDSLIAKDKETESQF
ncbi:hypothetical protein NQ314_003024, partial [Rhamnusium bicolor]